MKIKIGGLRAREHTVDITSVGTYGEPTSSIVFTVGPTNPLDGDTRPRVRLRFMPDDVVSARQLIAALKSLYGAAKHPTYGEELCPNCESARHARCCSQCGKVHKPARLSFGHCSAKCAREAAQADRRSAEMEEDVTP